MQLRSRHRNRAEITVLMSEQKPYPVWFPRRRKSYPLFCEHGLKDKKKRRRAKDWVIRKCQPHNKNWQFTFIWTLAVLGKFLLGGVKPLAIFCLVRGLLFVISLWLFCEHSKLVQQEARFSLYSLHKVMLDTFNFVPYIFFLSLSTWFFRSLLKMSTSCNLGAKFFLQNLPKSDTRGL